MIRRNFSLQPFSSAGSLLRKDEFEGRAGGRFRKGPPPSPQTPIPTPCMGLGEGLGQGAGAAYEKYEKAPGPLSQLKITGSIARRSSNLAIRYALRGDLAQFVIPAPADLPARRPGLWEETCFEFFLAVKHSPRYWEFNLSPAGHWNVYRFAGYREGMQEETAFTALPFSVRRQSDSLLLALELEVARIVRADQPLSVGITAVVKLAGGGLTYWALTHPGPQADFHRRDSFLVEL